MPVVWTLETEPNKTEHQKELISTGKTAEGDTKIFVDYILQPLKHQDKNRWTTQFV